MYEKYRRIQVRIVMVGQRKRFGQKETKTLALIVRRSKYVFQSMRVKKPRSTKPLQFGSAASNSYIIILFMQPSGLFSHLELGFLALLPAPSASSYP